MSYVFCKFTICQRLHASLTAIWFNILSALFDSQPNLWHSAAPPRHPSCPNAAPSQTITYLCWRIVPHLLAPHRHPTSPHVPADFAQPPLAGRHLPSCWTPKTSVARRIGPHGALAGPWLLGTDDHVLNTVVKNRAMA